METESSSRLLDDEDYLVRVRAQVMTRNDSSGGWIPMDGGGLSLVSLRHISTAQHHPPLSSVDQSPSDGSGDRENESTPKGPGRNVTTSGDVQYLIQGRRVCDDAVVLNCRLSKDLSYSKPNPTFHHWRVKNGQFGLTFHSSADAQSFQRCISLAAQQLQEQSNEEDESITEDEISLHKSAKSVTTETSSLPASRARTPSPLATHRVVRRHAKTPSPRLSLRVLPTSLSSTSSTILLPPAVPHLPSSSSSHSSHHLFSCPHLDFAKASKRYSNVIPSTMSSNSHSRCTGAPTVAKEIARESDVFVDDIFPDEASSTSTAVTRSELLRCLKKHQTNAKTVAVVPGLSTNNFNGMSATCLPASLDTYSTRTSNVESTAGPMAVDSYVHFQQNEDEVFGAVKKDEKESAGGPHDYSYPIIGVGRESGDTLKENHVKKLSMTDTINLSQFGSSCNSSPAISAHKYRSGALVTSRSKDSGLLYATAPGHTSLERLDLRDDMSDPRRQDQPRIKKLKIKIGSKHHSYPRSETSAGGADNKSPSRSSMSSVYEPAGRRRSDNTDKDSTSRLSTIQLPTTESSSRLTGSSTKSKKRDSSSREGRRAICHACNEVYDVTRNARGSCRDAPDVSMKCIERVTCMCCVQGALYHCARDEDDQYEPVCTCQGARAGGSRRRSCCRRWTIITILAVLLPCLWCYLPMQACHGCCVRAGHCGPRHREK